MNRLLNSTLTDTLTVKRSLVPLLLLLLACVTATPNLRAQSAPDLLKAKCGTSAAWSESQLKPRRQPLFALPVGLRDSMLSPSGRFMLHYDATASNPDSIADPAFVDRALLEEDSAYDYEVGTLGFPAPAFTMNGHYDIYLVPKPFGAFGATAQLDGGGLAASPSGLPRSRSYIVMDDRFTDPIYATKGFDALRITTFHEFFHLIQFADYGYSFDVNSWFQEMSSIWMEMQSTPEVKDYLYILGQYFATIDLRFDKNPAAGYGQGIFLWYLADRYGTQIIREIWQTYSDSYSYPISAIEHVLERHGTTFCKTYMEFGAELISSGRRLTAHSDLPDPELLPADSIKVNYLNPGDQASIDAFPTSLNFYETGFGPDSCVAVVARDTNLLVLGSGTIKFIGEGAYSASYTQPSLFCDTGFCFGSVTVFPNPAVLTGTPDDRIVFEAPHRAVKPVSVILDIYSIAEQNVYHKESSNVWQATWDGRDGAGALAPSGEYLFTLNTDGRLQTGKFVLIRK